MATYDIWHAKDFRLGTDLGYARDVGGVILALIRNQYERAGKVEADNLEDAFRLSQNDFGSWSENDRRSTSVGDLIIDPSGFVALVAPTGFVSMTKTGNQIVAAEIEG